MSLCENRCSLLEIWAGVFNGHLFLYHRIKIHTLKNFGGGIYGHISG